MRFIQILPQSYSFCSLAELSNTSELLRENTPWLMDMLENEKRVIREDAIVVFYFIKYSFSLHKLIAYCKSKETKYFGPEFDSSIICYHFLRLLLNDYMHKKMLQISLTMESFSLVESYAFLFY